MAQDVRRGRQMRINQVRMGRPVVVDPRFTAYFRITAPHFYCIII